jgi:Ferritin-like
LCRWLDCPLYMDLSSPEDLKTALQTVIELEHSTIPPYLCALYSIKPGANTEVATLIRSVVMEEMLHMALACNLLISIGGTLRIGQPQFVPSYPGPPPGGLRGGLTVRLRKCSIEQIRDFFLSIEQPEKPSNLSEDRSVPAIGSMAASSRSAGSTTSFCDHPTFSPVRERSRSGMLAAKSRRGMGRETCM